MMRRLLRGVGFASVACAGFAGTYVAFTIRPSSDAPQPHRGPPLTGEQWNALQDQNALKASFASLQSIRESGVVFYHLKGCPYCAKVRSTLDFYDLPYTPVTVDPVNFQELRAVPHKVCPQIQLVKPIDAGPTKANPDYPVTERGPFVADSEVIIKHITAAAGIDITAPEVAAQREWITRDVTRLVFVTGTKTFRRAFSLWPLVTPAKYHGIVFRIGGAVPMWLLGKYKVTGRLVSHYSDPAVVPTLSPGVLKAATQSGTFDSDVVLAAELSDFASKFSVVRLFHGGAKPDQVDVELFGLLRSQVQHGPITKAIRVGGLDDWYNRMAQHAPSRAITQEE